MLGMALFVDHTERAGRPYDIPLVVRNWDADRMFVFTGSRATYTDLQTKLHDREDITLLNLEIPINTPPDIYRGMNAAIRYMYERTDIDGLTWLQADLYLTAKGMDLVRHFHSQRKEHGLSLSYRHTQLYVCMNHAVNGLMYSGRSFPLHMNPGCACDPDWEHQIVVDQEEDLLQDIGYFTIEGYFQKIYNHNFIWPDPYKTRVLDAYRRDPWMGLRMAYQTLRKYLSKSLSPISKEVYKDLLSHYRAEEEYEVCKNIMKEFSSGS